MLCCTKIHYVIENQLNIVVTIINYIYSNRFILENLSISLGWVWNISRHRDYYCEHDMAVLAETAIHTTNYTRL